MIIAGSVKRMKRGAIFDMDGLMFDTERIWQESWQRAAMKRSVSLPEDFPSIISGTSGEKTLSIIRKYYRTEEADSIRTEVRQYTMARLAEGIPVKQGLRELLEYLKKNGVIMAVASSSRLDIIEHNLEAASVRSYFDAVVSGSGMAYGKPEPDIFIKAANALHLAPIDCWVLEDSINGIKAAHRTEAAAIMVPDLMKPTEEILSYAHVYTTLDALIPDMESGRL